MTDLRIGHGLGSHHFWEPCVTLSYHDLMLTRNLQNWGKTSQFTLKQAVMQMSTLGAYQYSNNMTIFILCIWVWEIQAICIKAVTKKGWTRKKGT